jgi:sugar phosphate isomerase/epimerase
MSHFEVNGLTIRQAVPALLPHASHVHVKAARGRYPTHEFMLPGEGDSDLLSLCRVVRDSGYTGYLTVEVSVFVQRRPDYDPLEALTICFAALSGALEKVGVTGYSRQC